MVPTRINHGHTNQTRTHIIVLWVPEHILKDKDRNRDLLAMVVLTQNVETGRLRALRPNDGDIDDIPDLLSIRTLE